MEWMWHRTVGHRKVPQRARIHVSNETPVEISERWLDTRYVELHYRAPHGKVYALLLAGMERDRIARRLKVSRRTIDVRCEDILMPEPVRPSLLALRFARGAAAVSKAAEDGWRYPGFPGRAPAVPSMPLDGPLPAAGYFKNRQQRLGTTAY